jgi:hypothetical protein
MFGVEYAGECHYGNQVEAGSVSTSTSDCSMLCAGNSSEFCGADDPTLKQKLEWVANFIDNICGPELFNYRCYF